MIKSLRRWLQQRKMKQLMSMSQDDRHAYYQKLLDEKENT